MKYFFHHVRSLLIVLVIVLIAGYAHASPYSAPTGNPPPANNTYFPVHQNGSPYGGDDQIKTGGLSVTSFLALMNAQFSQNLILQGPVHGGTPGGAASIVSFGGLDSNTAGTVFTRNVDVVISGGLKVTKTIRSASLAHPNQPGLKPVCVQAGTTYLILCP